MIDSLLTRLIRFRFSILLLLAGVALSASLLSINRHRLRRLNPNYQVQMEELARNWAKKLAEEKPGAVSFTTKDGQIEKLELAVPKLRQSDLEKHIPFMTALTTIRISRTSDFPLKVLSELPNLKSIVLDDMYPSASDLHLLANGCPRLETLVIKHDDSSDATMDDFENLAKKPSMRLICFPWRVQLKTSTSNPKCKFDYIRPLRYIGG